MSETQQKPLLAYQVVEDCEWTGGIVFACSNAEARRKGAQEFGDGDFNWGRATRASWADDYTPGPVPERAMFEHGWHFECAHCYRRADGTDPDAVWDFIQNVAVCPDHADAANMVREDW